MRNLNLIDGQDLYVNNMFMTSIRVEGKVKL